VRESGFQGYLERRIERHVDDQMQRFVKDVASRTLALHREHKFDYLIIGGSQAPIAAFEAVAHRYLSERLIGRVGFGPDASARQVLDEVSELVLTHEEMRGLQMIQRVIKQSETGGLGALGIEPTLTAISEGRVSALVVLKGTFRPGTACTHCSYLGVQSGACPQCGTDLLPVPDIIEEAVDRALSQSAEVLFVRSHEQLAKRGGLSALLRYR
jgi:peptide subunit release factor 1 (eRF1)